MAFGHLVAIIEYSGRLNKTKNMTPRKINIEEYKKVNELGNNMYIM